MSEAPAAAPLIELRGASVSFGESVALLPTDLAIRRGTTTILLGRSGSGKSTVLRLMVGLQEPTAGEVRFAGRPLRQHDLAALRHRVGFVIQEGGLFPHLTAAENVDLLARHLGHSPPERARRLSELCALTRLPESALGRYPAELSGGQRQRVALMRALALWPEILLLDEPLGALDPIVRSELQSDLREVVRGLKTTVVMVTHDLAEAAYFAGEIVLLDEGRIVQKGTLEDLRDRPREAFVSRFLHAQRSVAP